MVFHYSIECDKRDEIEDEVDKIGDKRAKRGDKMLFSATKWTKNATKCTLFFRELNFVTSDKNANGYLPTTRKCDSGFPHGDFRR